MRTLYKPAAFERLTNAPWDEGRVRAAIRAIVADADESCRGPRLLWRTHAWDSWRWRDAWNESAAAPWSRRGEDGLWTQRLYGNEAKGLTPPHVAPEGERSWPLLTLHR
jgi:hypothetical protein